MKAIWVDEGSDADITRLQALGIESPYFALRDERISLAYLRAVRSQGFKPGVYAAWSWQADEFGNGEGFAEWVDAVLTDMEQEAGFKTGADFPRVSLNIESHDVGYIIDALTRWRELRPTRTTNWTLEGHQGGLFAPEDVKAILATNVVICPQCYTGDMVRFESDWVLRDLEDAGFPRERISCFYDAAKIGYWWDSGTLFTQGRLP